MEEYKLIVAGSRSFTDHAWMERVLIDLCEEGNLKDRAVSIVSGMARGADLLAAGFARRHQVKLYEFPADWEKFGKSAGFHRNREMGHFSDGLLVFWDGHSRGTKHMIEYMRDQLEKPVHIIRFNP